MDRPPSADDLKTVGVKMNKTLEETLAFHCAPALMGLKPANLIFCDRRQYPSLEEELAALNSQLGPQGFCFWPICCCEYRVLLMVFQKDVLEKHLKDKQVQGFLFESGYPSTEMQRVLLHLQSRLSDTQSFPHEMGVILGYPVADVQGYLLHRGRHCKLTGYWQVYVNENETQALFRRFTRARKALYTLVSSGVPIVKLLYTA